MLDWVSSLPMLSIRMRLFPLAFNMLLMLREKCLFMGHMKTFFTLALQRNLMYIFLECIRFIGYHGLKSQKGGGPYVAGDSPN